MLGPGARIVGERMRPGPDQPLARDREAFQQTRARRSCSRRRSLRPHTQGTRSRSSPRRPSPASSTRRAAGASSHGWIQAFAASSRSSHCSRQPSPTRRGIGRARVPGQHRRGPVQHVEGEHAAAAVVDVVGVAVVRRAEGDDRLQRRRPAGGHLQRVEPAPGDSPHPDGARAPGLLSKPRDQLERVLLLLLACTRPRGCRRTRPSRACRRGRPRSRIPPGTAGAWRPAQPCRRSCGREGTRGPPGRDPLRRRREARSGPPAGQPSESGIQVCSISRTRRGNSVRMRAVT